MEMDDKLAERLRLQKWMKRAAAFLFLMWVCTILSKSIYVARLPFVQVKAPDKKYIEHVVSSDGIVTAGGGQAVNTIPGLRVSGIEVREGDLVAEGDLLFEIDLDDLSGLIADKEAELTKLQYRLADMQNGQILESQKKEVAVLWAQEDFELADRETLMHVERAQDALVRAQDALDEHLRTDVPHVSDSAREKAWNEYDDWKDERFDLMDRITAKEREIAGLQEELEALGPGTSGPEMPGSGTSGPGTDLPDTGDNVDEMGAEQTGTDQPDDKKEGLQAAIKKAEGELNALRDALTAHERDAVPQPDFTAAEAEYDDWQQRRSDLQDAVRTARCSLEDALYAREGTLRQKSRAIAEAQVFSPADSTASIYALDISCMQSDIEILKALKREEGRVTAGSSGFVSRIQIEVGGRTTDAAAVLLTDMEVPCQFKCSITKEQGKYLNLGDRVELKVYGAGASGGSLEVTVDYLTESASGGYDIICRLPKGIGQPGVGGSIRRAVQGELYTEVLPVEAICREREACYVYILREKAGILGKELYVEKIKVRVLDENDVYAALEPGIVGNDAQVVISCTGELAQGTVVRIGQ